MTNPDVHTETLKLLYNDDRFDALDVWVCAKAPNRDKELRLLSGGKKHINYNIGDRYGEAAAKPTSPYADERAAARKLFRREVDFALACGAPKIIFGSGPDYPGNRNEARKYREEMILEESARFPKGTALYLEPTDRDVDKRALFGPFGESAAFIKDTQLKGAPLYMLLDMGHIPLVHTSLEEAVEQSKDVLGHIHLGNCVIKNPSNPMYGDKHVAWGEEEGEYGTSDAERFVKCLKAAGYFTAGAKSTVTFEMRPMTGKTSDESMDEFISILDRAWDLID
jgi:sugar phosphate isomerase/epimerase